MWFQPATQQVAWNSQQHQAAAASSFSDIGSVAPIVVPTLHIKTKLNSLPPKDRTATCSISGMATSDSDHFAPRQEMPFFSRYSYPGQQATTSGSPTTTGSASSPTTTAAGTCSISSPYLLLDAEEATGDDEDIFRDFWLSQTSFVSGEKRRSASDDNREQATPAHDFLFFPDDNAVGSRAKRIRCCSG
jgi:hypothetical protein